MSTFNFFNFFPTMQVHTGLRKKCTKTLVYRNMGVFILEVDPE